MQDLKNSKKESFFKVTLTTVDVWGKEQLVDQNCGDLQEVHEFMDKVYEEHEEEYFKLMLNGMAWWSLYLLPNNISVASA